MIYIKKKGYNLKDVIKHILAEAINKIYTDDDFVNLIEVQNVTAKNVKADFFTNISMKLAKILKSSPMIIAEEIIKNSSLSDDITADIVKPGYINFIKKLC